MAKTLVVYQNDEVVKEEPKSSSGKTTVTISDLESNTEYPEGTYQIAWKDGDKESDKKDIPAFTTDKVAVETITVNNEDVTLDEGDTFNIEATISPSDADDKGVTYSSNNRPVATVSDNGEVTGVKSGNATITVKSTDNGDVTAKVKVKVNEVEDTSDGDDNAEEIE